MRKYVQRGDFSKSDILRLLDALGRFALKETFAPQIVGPMTGLVRLLHAHNALISFRDRPFTEEEFSASVRAVLRGQRSVVTREKPSTPSE